MPEKPNSAKYKYKSFSVAKYRGIKSCDLVIRDRLTPIIGLNESGKTSLLHSIASFDENNDILDASLRHLENSADLYEFEPESPQITATVSVDSEYISTRLFNANPAKREQLLIALKTNQDTIRIGRDLLTRQYYIDDALVLEAVGEKNEQFLIKHIRSKLPPIIYFDDFRDTVQDSIEITDSNSSTWWYRTLDQIVKRATNNELNLVSLARLENRRRNSALDQINKFLNNKITERWQQFRIEDGSQLEIQVSYAESTPEQRQYLQIQVVEGSQGNPRQFFNIIDRSKGFFWFFNFIMKLDFNPQASRIESEPTIFLLDEPGSYLHAQAQGKLTEILRELSDRFIVVYSTHSHYLLNTEYVKLSNIRICRRNNSGRVSLMTVQEFASVQDAKQFEYQPIHEALQLGFTSPFNLNSSAIICEGITDAYCVKLFGSAEVPAIPAGNAHKTKTVASIMFGLGVSCVILLDKDPEGLDVAAEFIEDFGDEFVKKYVYHYNLGTDNKKVILQDFFVGDELKALKVVLGLSPSANFSKTLAALFFSPDKDRHVKELLPVTANRFSQFIEPIVKALS